MPAGRYHVSSPALSSLKRRAAHGHFFGTLLGFGDDGRRDRVLTFSIVTPSYNQAAFISKTIESVLCQEGPFRIEYLVMDGGSSDRSVEIIRGWADRVAAGDFKPRCEGVAMAWQSGPDRGQSHAINEGLRRATGDVAAYINSDDLYTPGAFARVAAELLARPDVDFIHGDGDVIDASGGVQWEWLSRPYDHSVLTSYHFLWNDFTNYIMQQATFWRRSVHERIGYLDESFHFAMDAEFWVRAGAAGLKLRHLPVKLGQFRLIEGTKSLSGPTVFWGDYLEIFRRHRGAAALARYFAYYWYNVGVAADLDLAGARAGGQAVLSRFASLAEPERQTIRSRSEAGFRLATLLVATDLRKRGRTREASAAFGGTIRARPWLVLHPFACRYASQLLLGRWLFARVEAVLRRGVRAYRGLRFGSRRYRGRSSGF
jgi:glycosyltransferase involved in cell wall biosynthesis